jgi:hypothetical protein
VNRMAELLAEIPELERNTRPTGRGG